LLTERGGLEKIGIEASEGERYFSQEIWQINAGVAQKKAERR
jgi:hypothetical protein